MAARCSHLMLAAVLGALVPVERRMMTQSVVHIIRALFSRAGRTDADTSLIDGASFDAAPSHLTAAIDIYDTLLRVEEEDASPPRPPCPPLLSSSILFSA